MSIIENESYFKDFRQRCEDKNTLTKKGDLYVGTGNTIETNVDKSIDIYETTVLSAPKVANQVIISNGGNDGIGYKDILEALNGVIDDTGNNAVKRSKTSDVSKSSDVSEVSNKVKIEGYPTVTEATNIKIKVVRELPTSPDPEILYIIL